MLSDRPVLRPSVDRPAVVRGCAALGIVAGVLVGVVSAAEARQDCYTKAEFEAEQAIRAHTDMMMAGLKCQKAFKEKDPFGHYARFTQANSKQLRQWEATMIAFLKRNGSGLKQFDTFRTELANEVSRRTGSIPVNDYCTSQVEVVAEQVNMPLSAFRVMLNDEKRAHLSSYPICSSKPAVAKGKGAPAAVVAAPQIAASAIPPAAAPVPAGVEVPPPLVSISAKPPVVVGTPPVVLASTGPAADRPAPPAPTPVTAVAPPPPASAPAQVAAVPPPPEKPAVAQPAPVPTSHPAHPSSGKPGVTAAVAPAVAAKPAPKPSPAKPAAAKPAPAKPAVHTAAAVEKPSAKPAAKPAAAAPGRKPVSTTTN